MQTPKAVTLAFSLYNLAWTLALPFLKRKPRIADGITQRRLTGYHPGRADIWIQSASAGEAYLTAEILSRLDIGEPASLWLTSNTRQGLEILEQAAGALERKKPDLSIRVSFTPFDTPDLMDRAVRMVRPRLMVLIELEMWPGLLHALKKNHCPVLIVNGRLTPKSLKRYLLFPSLWKALAPDEVCAISPDDAQRFVRLFPESRVRILPNIKFDRVAALDEQANKNPLADLFTDRRPLVVLGSVREEEEEQVEGIIRAVTRKNLNILLLLFPRHLHRTDAWASRLDTMGINWRRRSEWTGDNPSLHVVLWDRFGELAHAYPLARAAFVGGSLAPLGGQNFLEVLQCGLIPVSGPHWENFAWVGEEIIRKGLLVIEQTGDTVAERLLAQVESPPDRDQIRQRAFRYLETKRGGTQATCERICALLNPLTDKDDTP